MKKAITILLALGLMLSLVACGGGGEADVTGKYTLYSWEVEGEVYDAEQLEEEEGIIASEYVININQDGTFTIVQSGSEQVAGTWEKSGDAYALTANEITINAVFDAAANSLTLNDEGEVLVFKK